MVLSKTSIGAIGPEFYDPPTVGSSGDFFWARTNGIGWAQYDPDGVVSNFAAKVSAVPEPNTILPLGIALGALGLAAYRRRKK